jgi:hypothetical protein
MDAQHASSPQKTRANARWSQAEMALAVAATTTTTTTTTTSRRDGSALQLPTHYFFWFYPSPPPPAVPVFLSPTPRALHLVTLLPTCIHPHSSFRFYSALQRLGRIAYRAALQPPGGFCPERSMGSVKWKRVNRYLWVGTGAWAQPPNLFFFTCLFFPSSFLLIPWSYPAGRVS